MTTVLFTAGTGILIQWHQGLGAEHSRGAIVSQYQHYVGVFCTDHRSPIVVYLDAIYGHQLPYASESVTTRNGQPEPNVRG